MKSLLTITIGLLTLGVAQAEMFTGSTDLSKKTLEDVIVMGSAHLREIKASSVKVTGTLHFDKLDVSGNVTVVGPVTEGSTDLICKDLQVVGPINAKRIKCTNIDVLGVAKLEDIEVSGDVKLVGGVEIKKANLQNLYVTSEQINLDDVTVKDITVDHIPLYSQAQTLYLKGSTTVSGSITFKSGKGIIVKEDKVKVVGKMVGGTEKKAEVEKKKEEAVKK